MPWREMSPMEQRQRLCATRCRRGPVDDRALCRLRHQPQDRLQIPRPLRHPRSRGPGRSVAPSSPLACRAPSGAAPAAARGAPAASVLGAAEAAPPRGAALAGGALAGALHRRALLPASRTRHGPPPRPPPRLAGPPSVSMDAPNAVWTTDYKGQFKLGDGQYCFPLTVADGYSRMLLACQALTSTHWSRPGPSSSGSSASTGSPNGFAPITACPSPPRRSGACRRSPSGGSDSASAPISSTRAHPSRTAATSACTSP